MRTRFFAILTAAYLCSNPAARADTAQDMGEDAMGRKLSFAFRGGEAIYSNVCQACHMARAQGAAGAGRYPALAKNAKLEEKGYPLAVVTHGQKGMPAFNALLSDQQIADVINYVRSHFGNNYADKVTPAEVKSQR